jgi:beta-glucosidase
MPVKQLRAFQRVSLEPGRTRTVTLRMKIADLAHWDVTRGRRVVESSVHDLLVGASSADIRLRGSLRVPGETIGVRDLTRRTRAESFDSYGGARLADESKARGTTVAAVHDGDWIAFRGSRLGTAFTARVANEGVAGRIEVRLGSPSGRLLGAAAVPGTGDRYAYTDATARLDRAAGARDVYLVLTAGVRVSEFRIG